MEIYVLRHGEAEAREPGVRDAERALTRRGTRDVRAVLKLASRAMDAPELILASPLRRAQETAAVAATFFPDAPLTLTDRLKPSASAEAMWKEACQDPGLSRVLLIGHEPHLSRLIALLLDAPVKVDFKKGALIRIDCAGRLGPPRGRLRWLITPKLARN